MRIRRGAPKTLKSCKLARKLRSSNTLTNNHKLKTSFLLHPPWYSDGKEPVVRAAIFRNVLCCSSLHNHPNLGGKCTSMAFISPYTLIIKIELIYTYL